ncbi:hydrogenase maturation protease [Caproiciproducens galactitolivorans]|uniref:hydrogenase maturation protease n=1 Tax=Caproiciproducens galactitolivorans TaxID=642589 RepID=UPI0024096F6F|nr:hydrogenase maturation protease [Caproiciproducens galactitolivorans]
MNNVSVVGIGNSLYCDDGVGCEVVRRLMERNKDDHLEFIIAESDIYYCLSKIHASSIVIVDALYAGYKPGSIHLFNLKECSACLQNGLSMHNQHLIPLLKTTGAFTILIIGIEPFELSLQAGLSHAMELCLPNIVNSTAVILSSIA